MRCERCGFEGTEPEAFTLDGELCMACVSELRSDELEGNRARDLSGKMLVDASWYEFVMRAFKAEWGCPFCGSKREPQVQPESRDSLPRRGCLDCGEWWDPVRLK
jgi:hypothetical protein